MRLYLPFLTSILAISLNTALVAQEAEPKLEPAAATDPEAQQAPQAPADIDIGQESIGQLRVSLIYGTNGDVTKAGKSLTAPNAQQLTGLSKLKKIKFKHYRNLGEDLQPILRSYENWAKPLKDSKEILLSFQPRGEATEGSLILDVEFWQSHKKILKGGIRLEKAKPLYIQGPDWRGGKVIVVVELVSLKGDK